MNQSKKHHHDTIHALLCQTHQLGFSSEEEQIVYLEEAIERAGVDLEKVKQQSKADLYAFRKNHHPTMVEHFIHQYPLTSKEGAALMQMAEALLRIPDSYNAELFVHDQFAEFQQGKELAKWSDKGLHFLADLVVKGKWMAPVVDPILLKALGRAMRVLGHHFVLGETIEQALSLGKGLEEQGFLLSFDMLGEGARTASQAERYFQSYSHAIKQVAASAKESSDLYSRPNVSVKLSALHPSYTLLHYPQVKESLVHKMIQLAREAKQHDVVLIIDAEESYRLDVSLCVLEAVLSHPELQGFDGIGLAVQAYNRRAYRILDVIIELAERYNRKIPVRLVKGAYWDTEVKYAQTQGLTDYHVFTQKIHTDISYHACACKLYTNRDKLYPLFATHNMATISFVRELFQEESFEFQLLYGMGTGIYQSLATHYPCRIYAPVGPYKELLPYLIRRLLENNANSSFLNQIADRHGSVEKMIDYMFDLERAESKTLPLPSQIYHDRLNSSGVDFGNIRQVEHVKKSLKPFYKTLWKAYSFIDGKACESKRQAVYSPSHPSEKIGEVAWLQKERVEDALASAHRFYRSWNHVTVEERATMLETVADLFEASRYELAALCMREGGKTCVDAFAEIREAVDFCRYYASSARRLLLKPQTLDETVGEHNELSLHSRGVFVCISPWNFPMAIFVGQIAASLASGNVVIAKPSSLTPLISSVVVQLFYKAGFPKKAIQLLLGESSILENDFFEDPRIAGVAFTGSTAVAQHIAKHLSQRKTGMIPLIAETGGQNAMIVDSTALIEQVVDDVIQSAFGSAGQRCSALRILYVQEDIADTLLEQLTGALAVLRVGDPYSLDNDVGPLISESAAREIRNHIAKMKRYAKLVATADHVHTNDNGYYVIPHIFLMDSLKYLTKEVFGPILHVKKFASGDFTKVIDEVNQLGYGLTLGLHTRIPSRIAHVRQRAEIGNIYINRPMTGAIVGAQPFGGEKLSGTGPKAGGPYYLLSFMTERTCSVNLMALGGDPELFT